MAEIIDLSGQNSDRKFEEAITQCMICKTEDNLLQAKIFYYRKRVDYEEFLKEEDNDLLRYDYGMGFWLYINDYHCNPIILHFIAKCMVDEISELVTTSGLEKKIHVSFNSLEELQRSGVRSYLIEFIKGYDEALSRYVSIHTDLLADLEQKVSEIIDEWKKFDKYNNIDQDVLYDIIHEFTVYTEECTYSAVELLYYLKFKMNIQSIVLDDDISLIDDFELTDEEFYKMTFRKKTIQEEKVLIDFEKVIDNYILDNIIPDPYIETEKRKKDKQRKR